MRFLLKKIFRRLYSIKVRWEEKRNEWKLYFSAGWLWDCRISGGNNRYSVALKIEGSRGRIDLGNRNQYGYRHAPRVGDGSIFIQAREPDSSIQIGDDCAFSNNISIVARQKIVIGQNFLCGEGVKIFDSDFHSLDPAKRFNDAGQSKPVLIGKNVWLGSNVIVLKGVEIGDNTVVGAGSIVTKSLPSNVVAVGMPARVIAQL